MMFRCGPLGCLTSLPSVCLVRTKNPRRLPGLARPLGAVTTVPLLGGTPTTLFSGPGAPQCVATDGLNIYLGMHDATGGVLRLPVGGGNPTTLATGQWANYVTVDSTEVYWTSGSTVMKVSRGGGTPTTVASGQGSTWAIAVDSTSVYWTNVSGPIMKVPIGGGTPTTLATGPYANSIAVDSTSVYWTVSSAGTVMKLTPK